MSCSGINFFLRQFGYSFWGLFFGLALIQFAAADENPINTEGAFLFSKENGERLRVTPYGYFMIRVQRLQKGESLLPDDHYEMVEHHDWPREFELQDKPGFWRLVNFQHSPLQLHIDKKTLALTFIQQEKTVLQEKNTWRDGSRLGVDFVADKYEHFAGLGHSFYGREDSIDLRGKKIGRNYGSEPIEQAPLIVPFYLSSKGYGIFLNSTFTNEFHFATPEKDDGQKKNGSLEKDNKAYRYSMALDGQGASAQLDYFFIGGADLRQVLDHYTQLTGRPRLPAKAIFGLQLSDKSHDHDSPTPSDQTWWQEKIREHRAAGYPLDHVVNDNRWRAGGGKRCEARMEWDRERYPDPKAYADWLAKEGLITTLDINRCIAQYSKGWKAAFNIRQPKNIEFDKSAPDLTNPQFREWFWNIFYTQSLDPALGFPGDALWIDEFDEMGSAPASMELANGRTWGEMRNYWFFLIAKALVQDGWDKSALSNKRPYVWVRGMTAGAQRYASLWTGDIYPNYEDMQAQIRAMQLAGLAGFPFWGHDAGGFYDWNNQHGPDEKLYAQWAMAFGSFAPIWKPHGMGQSRWPLDRSAESQKVARYFALLRYELMPYLYTAAHQAAATGLPIARPLLLDYPSHEAAWTHDLQYLWGDSLLVAPNASSDSKKTLWLPPGRWYEFASQRLVQGDKVISVDAPAGFLPLYVKQGSIIPRYDYSLSTAFANKQHLWVDVYTGADATAELIEDDDRSEDYRQGQLQRTPFTYHHQHRKLVIGGAQGSYKGAPQQRRYQIRLIGDVSACWTHQGKRLKVQENADGSRTLAAIQVPIAQSLTIEACRR